MAIAANQSRTVVGNWVNAALLIQRPAIAKCMTGRNQTTITIAKTTHEAVKAIADEHGYQSLHAFVADCCLKADSEKEQLPDDIRRSLEEVTA